jgi:hypothetical protein
MYLSKLLAASNLNLEWSLGFICFSTQLTSRPISLPPNPREIVNTMTAIQTEEGSLALPDGLKLYTKTWKPSVDIKARLVFLHGFSE